MKLRSNKGFPYPVLSPYGDDYCNSSFDVDIKSVIDGYDLALNFDVKLNNDELTALIASGKAEYVFHIECPTSGFRSIVKTDSNTTSYSIPFKKLKDLIEINSFVIAKEDIKAYSNASFNTDYEGMSFDLKKGCVMAEGIQVDTRVPKKITDFKEQDDPFVLLIPDKNETSKTVTVVLEDEKIKVIVPEATAAKYKALQQTKANRPILIGLYILPALWQGLLRIKGSDEIEILDYEQYLWVQSLEEILQTAYNISFSDLKQKSDEELFVLAQKMLECPLVEGVDTLMSMGGESRYED